MIDEDIEWLESKGFILVQRNADNRESPIAPGVTFDLWDFLNRTRQQAIRRFDLDTAYGVNSTIIRLKEIAARTGLYIGRSRVSKRPWTDEQRAEARERALAQGLGGNRPRASGQGACNRQED